MDFKGILFRLLVLLSVSAVLVGLYYYIDQLAATPTNMWIFVPDCPLYVFLAILVIKKAVKSDAFAFLVSVGMMKYGIWTALVLLFHWDFYSLPELLPVTLVFIVGHIGMALLGAALIPKKKVGLWIFLLSLGWFLVNDFADYALGTRPPIPARDIALVAIFTIALSLGFTALAYFYRDKVRSFQPARFVREIIGMP